jgi:O-Antigen ligase
MIYSLTKEKLNNKAWLIASLIVFVLPFSPLLITILAGKLGGVVILSAWKEIALFLLGTVILLTTKGGVFSKLSQKPVLILVVIYIAWLILTLISQFDGFSSIAGFVYLSRFFMVFVIALVAAAYIKNTLNLNLFIKFALAICAVGLFILLTPPSLLVSLGYDKPGVDTPGVPAAIHYVSDNLKVERMMSSLRSPNSLGVYLLLPFALLLFNAVKGLSKKFRIFSITILLLCIIGTFSRTALIGIFIIIFVYTFTRREEITNQIKKIPKKITAVAALLCIATAILAIPFAGPLVLHESDNNARGSTSTRITQYQGDIKLIAAKPINGTGLGSASAAGRVKDETVLVSENYYFMLAKETGLIGLTLFLSICFMVLKELLEIRKRTSYAVAAVFIAVIIGNFFLPLWAEETVSITIWLFIGYVLGKGLYFTDKKHTNMLT